MTGEDLTWSERPTLDALPYLQLGVGRPCRSPRKNRSSILGRSPGAGQRNFRTVSGAVAESISPVHRKPPICVGVSRMPQHRPGRATGWSAPGERKIPRVSLFRRSPSESSPCASAHPGPPRGRNRSTLRSRSLRVRELLAVHGVPGPSCRRFDRRGSPASPSVGLSGRSRSPRMCGRGQPWSTRLPNPLSFTEGAAFAPPPFQVT